MPAAACCATRSDLQDGITGVRRAGFGDVRRLFRHGVGRSADATRIEDERNPLRPVCSHLSLSRHALGRRKGVRMTADTRYAKSGDVHIAYQLFGEGADNLVYIPGFMSHIENYWEPSFARKQTAA